MKSLVPIQTAIALLFGAIGIWIMIAPVAVGFQDFTKPWTAATTNDIWTGAVLVLISLGLLTAALVSAVRARLHTTEAAPAVR